MFFSLCLFISEVKVNNWFVRNQLTGKEVHASVFFAWFF